MNPVYTQGFIIKLKSEIAEMKLIIILLNFFNDMIFSCIVLGVLDIRYMNLLHFFIKCIIINIVHDISELN